MFQSLGTKVIRYVRFILHGPVGLSIGPPMVRVER